VAHILAWVRPINFDSSTSGQVPATGLCGEKEVLTREGNSWVPEGQLVAQE
jgi:hypothetical protein